MSERPSGRMSRSGTALFVLCLGTACAEAPEFAQLDMPLPVAFAATPDATLPRQVEVLWWRQLQDPIVDQLVQQVYADNISLRNAAMRVSEAEALRANTQREVSITGDSSAQAQRDFDAGSTESGTISNAGLTWLFDPFGRIAAERALAENNLVVAKAEVASARQVVTASLLNTYIDLRFQQARRATVSEEIGRRRAIIAQQQRSADAGNVTQIALLDARAQLANRQAELPRIDAEIQILKNQLAVLAGVAPGRLAVDLDTRRPQPLPRAFPSAGLPADLMRNRADLFLLERAYYAARLNVTQAEADLYPSLSIGGTLAVSTLGSDSTIGTIGPRITLPALPNGGARGAVEAAGLRVRIAYNDWSEAVLEALASVEAAILSLQAGADALRSADQSVALRLRSLELTRRVLEFDGATLADVTRAEDELSAAELQRDSLRQAYTRAFVDLHVQLGSGEVLALSAVSPN